MERKTRYRQDDITLLLPSFQPEVQAVLDHMTGLGFKPVLFDGLRTPEEALKNEANGKGKANSIHIYGAAADVICDEHGWSCAQKKCKFYTKLVGVVRSRGLVTGADFHDKQGRPKVDQPHFQAVLPKDEAKMRAFGAGESSVPSRDKMVQSFLKERDAAQTKK